MAQKEIGEVGDTPRISFLQNFGNDLESHFVNQFKYELVDMLRKNGYRPVPYSLGGTDVVAYEMEEVPFRQEPIIIDDGRTIIERDKVLKIAVRDAHGANRSLHDRVLELLHSHVLHDLEPGSDMPCEEGTVVYALKRF